jgi:hypothetical protein
MLLSIGAATLSDLHLLMPKTLSMPNSAPRPRHDLVQSRHLQPLEKLPDQVCGKEDKYTVHRTCSHIQGQPLGIAEVQFANLSLSLNIFLSFCRGDKLYQGSRGVV